MFHFIYDQIQRHILALGKTPKEALAYLTNPKNTHIALFLSIVFNAESIPNLAIKFILHKRYLEKGGNPDYILHTQPTFQQHYYNLNTPLPPSPLNRWKKLAALARQDHTQLTLSPKALSYLHSLHQALENTLKQPKKDIEVLDPILYRIQMASALKDHLTSKERQATALSLSQDNPRLLPTQQVLWAQFQVFFNLLGHLTTRFPIQESPISCFLSRNESDLLYEILKDADYFDIPKIEWNLDVKVTEHLSIWPLTLHGRGKDARSKLSDASDMAFPCKGKLWSLDPKTLKPKLLSTQGYRFKSNPHEAAIVITLDGKIHLFSHFFGQEKGPIRLHSLVTAGKPVLFAGSITIQNGIIQTLGKNSNHYQPNFNLSLLLFLKEKGLLHPKIQFVIRHTFSLPLLLYQTITQAPGAQDVQTYLKKNLKHGFYHILELIALSRPKPQFTQDILIHIFKNNPKILQTIPEKSLKHHITQTNLPPENLETILTHTKL